MLPSPCSDGTPIRGRSRDAARSSVLSQKQMVAAARDRRSCLLDPDANYSCADRKVWPQMLRCVQYVDVIMAGWGTVGQTIRCVMTKRMQSTQGRVAYVIKTHGCGERSSLDQEHWTVNGSILCIGYYLSRDGEHYRNATAVNSSFGHILVKLCGRMTT